MNLRCFALLKGIIVSPAPYAPYSGIPEAKACKVVIVYAIRSNVHVAPSVRFELTYSCLGNNRVILYATKALCGVFRVPALRNYGPARSRTVALLEGFEPSTVRVETGSSIH